MMIKIDVGCGTQKKKGFIGIDREKCKGVNIVADITKKQLPYKKSEVDEIFCKSMLEHLDSIDVVMQEFHRVVKPGGRITIITPYWKHPVTHQPFHKLYFGKNSLDMYFRKTNRMAETYPQFKCHNKGYLDYDLNAKFIYRLKWYENFFSWFFPARFVKWEISPIK